MIEYLIIGCLLLYTIFTKRKLYLVTINVYTIKNNVCIDKCSMIGGLFRSKKKAQDYAKSISSDTYSKSLVDESDNVVKLNIIITPLTKNKIMYYEDHVEKGWVREQPL